MNPSTSSAPEAGESAPVCGVVVYEVRAGELRGRWTVNTPAYEGKTGTEVATGGEPGVLAGTYKVEIFDPDGRSIYRGTLRIAQAGDSYRLEWRGGDGDFDGLGLTVPGNHLAASYWRV